MIAIFITFRTLDGHFLHAKTCHLTRDNTEDTCYTRSLYDDVTIADGMSVTIVDTGERARITNRCQPTTFQVDIGSLQKVHTGAIVASVTECCQLLQILFVLDKVGIILQSLSRERDGAYRLIRVFRSFVVHPTACRVEHGMGIVDTLVDILIPGRGKGRIVVQQPSDFAAGHDGGIDIRLAISPRVTITGEQASGSITLFNRHILIPEAAESCTMIATQRVRAFQTMAYASSFTHLAHQAARIVG